MSEGAKIPAGFCRGFEHHAGAREFLWQTYATGRVGSAYLFVGPYGVGKFACALEWIRFLKCTDRTDDGAPCGRCRSCRNIANWDHPDVMILFPMPKSVWENETKLAEAYEKFREFPYERPKFAQQAGILIDMVREVQKFLSTPAGTPGGKFVIIADAHAMNIQAANAFLKTLEEPPPGAHIIMTTHRADSILPTILSRTQIVKFNTLKPEQIAHFLQEKLELPPDRAAELAALGGGSLAESVRFASPEFRAIRDEAKALLEWAVEGKILPLWEWVNSAPKSIDYASTLLKVLLSASRDIMVKCAGGETMNRDMDEIIAAAAKKIASQERAAQLVREISRLGEDTARNLQYSLFYGAVVSALVRNLS